MRLMTENKARTATERCPHCGRPVGSEVEQCRVARGGWFCWQRGYILDASQVAPYVPDPAGEPEQAVIEEFAPQLAEQGKRVDELLVTFTTVETSYRSALFAGAEIGVGPLMTPGYGARPASPRERKRVKELIEQAASAREAVGERLQKARSKLHHLEARCDHKRRVARQPVQEEE